MRSKLDRLTNNESNLALPFLALPSHAVRNKDSLAMDSVQYYAICKVPTLC